MSAMEGSSNPPLDRIGVLSIMPGKQGNTCKGKRSRPTLKLQARKRMVYFMGPETLFYHLGNWEAR